MSFSIFAFIWNKCSISAFIWKDFIREPVFRYLKLLNIPLQVSMQYIYKGGKKSIYHFVFSMYLLKSTSFFYQISFLFDALFPAIHTLTYSLQDDFQLVAQPLRHHFLGLWKDMIVIMDEIWPASRMLRHPNFLLINGINDLDGRIGACLFMQQQSFFWQ